MFALLLSDMMDPFYQNISSFPTVIYTLALGVCVIYWAGAILGLIDINLLDVDLDGMDLNVESGHSAPDVLAGLMLRAGVRGVPVTVSLSLIALIGWILSYYSVHFLFGSLDGLWRYVAGVPVLLVTLVVAALITAQLIRPLRPLFESATRQTVKQVLGQTAVVKTLRVDNEFGEASLADGGAGLILKVRSTGDDRFKKGDRVVIFEKLEHDNIYRVISEQEFAGR